MICLNLKSVSKFNKPRVPLKQQRVFSFVSTSPAYQHPTLYSFLVFSLLYMGMGDLHTNKKLKEKSSLPDYQNYIVGDNVSCKIVQSDFFKGFRSRNIWNLGR